jgi:hypothetical protein
LVLCLVDTECTAFTGPGGYDLPEEDASLDPARLRVGDEIYYCGKWNPQTGPPSVDRLFVDVFFGTGDSLVRLDHPLAVHRFIVESVGATVVRSYHLPGFRVWMPTDSVPVLSGHGGIIVRAVPNPSRFDVMVAVYFGALAFGQGDSARVAALGGQVVSNYEFLGIVVLRVPDRSLGAIRRDARVAWIEPWADFLCLEPAVEVTERSGPE